MKTTNDGRYPFVSIYFYNFQYFESFSALEQVTVVISYIYKNITAIRTYFSTPEDVLIIIRLLL